MRVESYLVVNQYIQIDKSNPMFAIIPITLTQAIGFMIMFLLVHSRRTYLIYIIKRIKFFVVYAAIYIKQYLLALSKYINTLAALLFYLTLPQPQKGIFYTKKLELIIQIAIYLLQRCFQFVAIKIETQSKSLHTHYKINSVYLKKYFSLADG